MSKIIKVVALVVIAVAIVIYAAPIAGALAGLGAGTASAALTAAITSSVIGVGISIGLSAVGTLFRKAPSLSNSLGDRLSTTIVPSAPRKIVFGRTAAGNDERFFEVWGSKKDSYARVIALASHRVNAVSSFYIENTLTWQNGGLVAHSDGISVFRAVTEGKPGNGFSVGSGAYWKPTATFTGCAYIAVTYKVGEKPWPKGIPAKNTTIVEGCPLYDARLDSTRGGSGSHRVEDQNTWEWRSGGIEIGRNPANAMLTYLIGYRINGRLAWGMGVPDTSINYDNFRQYANICEERVQSAGGGTVQRYTCDGIFSTSDSHETVMSAITAAMGSCKLVDVGGAYQFVGGFDDTLGPKQAFDENDLIAAAGSSAPFSWVPAGPSRETYNIVSGKFASPAELYQFVDWGRIESEALPDGVPRSLTLDFGCVDRAETCQRIAKQFLAREALTPGYFTATFGPKAFLVTVGSLVTLSLPIQGWNAKLFRVMEQHEVHDMIYQMTLREESAAVYAWDKDEALALPPTIRPEGYDASMKIPVEGLTLTSLTYQGAD